MFFVLSRAWDKEKILSRTSNLRIPPSDALPLSYRDSTVRDKTRDKTKNIFLYFFTWLKTYHLYYSIHKIILSTLLILAICRTRVL